MHLLFVGVVVLALVGLFGCGEDAPSPAPDHPHYVTTIHPLASIVAPVVGERGSVTTLLVAGDAPHTYEPRSSDVQRAEEGTAVLYGAPHFDAWAADLPASHHVALLDLVPAEYRLPAASEDPTTDAVTIDPRFWTDPLAVRALLPALTDTLCALDTAGCTTYEANADSFSAELAELDTTLRAQLDSVRTAPVLLAQPFFQYFMHRYGPQLAGVVEPNPAQEPSPRAQQALIEHAHREGAQALFVQNQLSSSAVETVAEGAGLPVDTLDPVGGTAGRQSYDELLRYNARTIRDALGASTSP